MIAIWKKEFRTYLHTVIGWLFIAANLFFVGLYFTIYNLLYGSAYFASAISASGFILLLSVPVLTMKVLAEERKTKTDQLLLTAPVSLGKIVLGKYMALASVFTIPMLIICLYPLLMRLFGQVPMAEAYTSILGFYLYGLACLAVGVLISSLTENQVIAAVISFVILFACYIMDGLCGVLSQEGNLVTDILGCFSFYKRFYAFLNGTLDIRAVIYFITAIILMLFLTCQSIQKRRWNISAAGLKTGAYNSTLVVMACVLAVFVNLAAGQLPENIASVDVTQSKLYALTDETIAFLEKLDQDVTIYVYGTQSGLDETVSQTLSRMEGVNARLHLEYRDPVKYPNFPMEYTTQSLTENSLIVVCKDKSRAISYNDLYETSFDYSTYTSTATGYDGEGRITSAIDYVTSEDTPVLYSITGHGEQTLDNNFQSALSKANFAMQTINLMNYEQVPEDADAILLNAPTSDYSEDDARKVKDYLSGGGKAIVVTNYAQQEMTQFASILSAYGVTLYEGIVADNSTANYYQAPFYLLPEVEDTVYTSGIIGKKYIFAPYAQGLRVSEEDDTLAVTSILTTSGQAVVKKDVNQIESYEAEDGDETGSFVIGAQITKTEDEVTSDMFVFSSATLFTDAADQMVSGANLALFTNVIGSLSDERETIAIPVKEFQQSSLTVPQSSFLLLGLCCVLLLPIILLGAGIVIWIRRRRR